MENFIMNVKNQTPIEIALQVDEDGTVSAKKVYEFLGLLPANYSTWCKRNIINNEFAEENADYRVFVLKEENPQSGRPTMDYKLSVPFAKKLCMLQRSERGEQARDYFIKVEEALKNMTSLPQLTTNELLLQMAQANVELERKVRVIEESQSKIEQKLETAIQVFSKPDKDHWKEDMNQMIDSMVETYGLSFLKFKGTLYAELEEQGVCLYSRQTRLRARMKKQGATYKECKAVTKLDVISNDKQLRTIFEGIVKKYQAMYATSLD